jgi:hypothetical protein
MEESMSQLPIWFERKFDFSFPVEMLPNLCARLRSAPARLEEVLSGRSHTILIGKAQVKWSAQEIVGHLLDLSSRANMGTRQRRPAGANNLCVTWS